MLHHLARKYSACTDTTYIQDELVSVANAAFMKAVSSWDPIRGARFSNHLYRVVRNAMIDTIKQWQHFKSLEEEEMCAVWCVPYGVSEDFTRALNELPNDDAKQLAWMIVCDANLFQLNEWQGSRRTKQHIRKRLEGFGWSWMRIKEAFRGIKQYTEVGFVVR